MVEITIKLLPGQVGKSGSMIINEHFIESFSDLNPLHRVVTIRMASGKEYTIDSDAAELILEKMKT